MSFVSFGLEPRLLKGIERLDFEHPTPIQRATIPVALTGQDILGSAETGTGKTAAYLLPVLHRLLKSTGQARRPRALVLVPTRELALQVAEQAHILGTAAGLHTLAVYGGVALSPQQQSLARGAEVVIATPGRLLDLVARRSLQLDGIQILVIDEADRMLDVGFLPDLRRIVRLLPRERQTMLFSATLSPILGLAAEVTRQPARIEVSKTTAPAAIQQTLLTVPEHLKTQAVQTLLRGEEMDSVLIFTRTKHRADRLAKMLTRAGIDAAVIHGNRSQNQRIAALEAFRHGRTRVLVATDIAARGIDVEGISHVVNFDVPAQPDDYVHRIGRTGRAEATGTAYTLVTLADEPLVRRIEAVLKHKIERRRVDGIDYAAPALVQPDAEAIRRYREANRRPAAAGPAAARAR